jgi:(1->4)-alpha-D-glucan 1-alpha-D-glucosylmutase
VGAWPISACRVRRYLAKAAREAKVHTSWIDQNPQYEEALGAFAGAVVGDQAFVADLEAFLAAHLLVERGRVTSLAQTALLLTCPGVPDIYQGSELWDLSLVDPDNRRPVDYEARRALLASLADATPEQALAVADAGGPKIWLIQRLLAYRARHPAAFAPGSQYRPLAVSGAKAEHAVAFARTAMGEEDAVVVVVPRLVARLAEDWAGAAVELPPGTWTDALAGEQRAGRVSVADLLGRFPVAVLGRSG